MSWSRGRYVQARAPRAHYLAVVSVPQQGTGSAFPAVYLKMAGCRKNRHGYGHEGLSFFTDKCGEDEKAFRFPVP